jgi:hypothetical protein
MIRDFLKDFAAFATLAFFVYQATNFTQGLAVLLHACH